MKEFFQKHYKKMIVATVLALALVVAGTMSADATLGTREAPAVGDIVFGNAGVYIPAGAPDGTVTISRFNTYPGGVKYTRAPIKVEFNYKGAAYVYFNLQKHERNMWEAGTLRLVYSDPENPGYSRCIGTFLVESENFPEGRLACYTGPADGWYALAQK